MVADAGAAHASAQANAVRSRKGRIRPPCGPAPPPPADPGGHRGKYVVFVRELRPPVAGSTPCNDAPQSGLHLRYAAVRGRLVATVLGALALAPTAHAAVSLPSVPSGARP